MNVSNFRYDTRDFGRMGHPPVTKENLISPDFGCGQRFGFDCMGALDQGSYHYSDVASASPELAQLEIDAANQKASDLQVQIDQLTAQVNSGNSVATMAQINSLQQEMAATKAKLPILAQIKPYLPYVAAGGFVLVALLFLGRRK